MNENGKTNARCARTYWEKKRDGEKLDPRYTSCECRVRIVEQEGEMGEGGGVYGVRCLAGQRERPGALVRMSIRLSICVSVGALWELAAYCGSPVGGLCAPVHEKRPRERPPLPVAADGRFAAAHTPVGDDDREGEGERVGEEDGYVGG